MLIILSHFTVGIFNLFSLALQKTLELMTAVLSYSLPRIGYVMWKNTLIFINPVTCTYGWDAILIIRVPQTGYFLQKHFHSAGLVARLLSITTFSAKYFVRCTFFGNM